MPSSVEPACISTCLAPLGGRLQHTQAPLANTCSLARVACHGAPRQVCPLSAKAFGGAFHHAESECAPHAMFMIHFIYFLGMEGVCTLLM
jgi:hypothetical protein